MTAARFYSSTAGSMELQADITAASTSLIVDTTTGLPGTTPFTVVIDPGTNKEEILDVTGVAGTTLTITRGVDSSPAQTHTAGAVLRHMATARDFRDAQEHIGFTQNVHGIGATSSVVGTDTTQVLKNKTLQASAAGVQGAVVKGFAGQTAPYLEVQDSTGVVVAKVGPGSGTVTVGNVLLNGSGADGLAGYAARFTSGSASIVGQILKAAAGQTADIWQAQNSSGAVLAKFDSGGNLTAPSITTAGTVTAAAANLTNSTVSGTVNAGTVNATTLQQGGVQAVTTTGVQTLTNKTLTAPATTGLTGDTVTLTGAASVGSVTSTGAIAGTAVSGTTGTFSGAVTGSNLTATSTKAGKKLHWGFKTNQTLTGAGDATFTHGCGFTPQSVTITPTTVGLSWSVDNITATTFDVHFRLAAGGSWTTATSFSFICGE